VRHRIELADNLVALATLRSESIPLIYIDPPFNTGKRQQRTTTRSVAAPDGDHTGFAGRHYRTTRLNTHSYPDAFDDYLAFLEPRLREAHRVLTPNGTLYVHLDYREVHYVKVLLDEVFGRSSFLNEIIWVYDYGGRPRNRWPAKHDNVLVYVKDPKHYVFNGDDVEREPYMAPGLVTPEKAARGKMPSDCWWHTIVSPTGKEKTGYPTQKPLGVLKRVIAASSRPNDLVLDFFAGSGTTGAAALALGRRFHLVDNNPEAAAVMARRFAGVSDVEYVGFEPSTPLGP
jgi:site-specific DNA-methyltransferase (adenine-specific)